MTEIDRSGNEFSTALTTDVSMPYRTYLPNDYSTSGPRHPLLLFLHGIGECGTDPDADCRVEFTVYSNADHDSWTETYQNPAIYEWLLSHQKPQA